MNKKKSLGMLLRQVEHAQNMLIRENMSKLGIPKTFGPIILELEKNEGITQSELALLLHFSAPTVSVTLQQMSDTGYVNRQQDPSDQRQSHLFLTEQGIMLSNKIHRCFKEIEDELITVLSSEEEELLYTMLERIFNHFVPSDKRFEFERPHKKRKR